MIGIILVLCIAIICLGVYVFILKQDLKFYKALTDDYREHSDKSIALAKTYEEDAKKFLKISQEGLDRNAYMIYLIEHLNKVIDYAGHFLKPRKKKEMYHIANSMLTYEQWYDRNKK